MQDDCLLWEIWSSLHRLQLVRLYTLHDGHHKVVRMKEFARSHLWWPNGHRDIKNFSFKCDTCQQKAHNPMKSELYPLEFLTRPLQRLHIDFAGPIFGFTWLLYADGYSKYARAIPLTTTTASSTSTALLEVFSHFGQPGTDCVK